MKVEAREALDLETPGDVWVTLGRKLAAASTKISHGEPGGQLALTSNAALSCGQVASGRALLALVFEYYSAGTTKRNVNVRHQPHTTDHPERG